MLQSLTPNQLQDNPVFHKLQTNHFYQILGAKNHFETHVMLSWCFKILHSTLVSYLIPRPYGLGNSQQPGGNIQVLQMLWKSSTEVPRPLDKPKPLPRAPLPRATGQPGTVLEEWRRRSHGSSFAKKKTGFGNPKVFGWIFFTIMNHKRFENQRFKTPKTTLRLSVRHLHHPKNLPKAPLQSITKKKLFALRPTHCNLEWGRGWNFPALSLHCHSQALRAKYRFQDVAALPTSPPATVH